MTRFARAKGSKSSNERTPEDGTPWEVMKEQLMRAKKDGEEAKQRQEAEKQRMENYENFLKEQKVQKRQASWCDFPGVSHEHKKPKIIPDMQREELHHQKNKNTVKHSELNGSKFSRTSEPAESNSLPPKQNADNGDTIESIKKQKKKNKNIVPMNENIVTSAGNEMDTEVIEQGDEEETGAIEAPLNNKQRKNNKKNKTNTIESIKKQKKKNKNIVAMNENIVTSASNEMDTEVIEQGDKQETGAIEAPLNNKQRKKNKKNKTNVVNGVNNEPSNNNESKTQEPSQAQDNKKQENNTAKKKNKKKLKDGKPVRRKEINDNSFQFIINGKEVDLVRFEGFPIMRKDADRLEELKTNMIKKGIPKSEVQRTIKLERRRAEKALARLKRDVCYNCRKGGHNLSDCPDLKSKIPGVDGADGVCFKCGSTEHRQFECKVQKNNEFRFASCFICKEQGHIARQCPDNPKGLYPNGGGCKLCGDVTHLRKDCPTSQDQRETSNVKLQTLDSADNIEDINQQQIKPTTEDASTKKVKKIMF